jgi:hypothetical protein
LHALTLAGEAAEVQGKIAAPPPQCGA